MMLQLKQRYCILAIFAMYLAGASLACGDSEDGVPFAEGDDLYLVFYTNQTPDGITSFVGAVPSLSATSTINPAATLEIGGFIGLLGSNARDGVFYVALSDRPRIDRYEVSDAGELRTTGSMSYGPVGTSEGNFMLRPNHFLRQDRAFFVAASALKVVIWNPQTMELEGEIDLSGLVPDSVDLVPRIINSELDNGRLLISCGYFRADRTATRISRVAIVDMETELVQYTENTRCGFPTLSMRDSDNNIYFVSHPLLGAAFAAGAARFPPCMTRIPSGSDMFDQSFFLDLTTLTGRPAASVAPAANGRAYVTISPRQPDEFTPENYEMIRFSGEWEVYTFDPMNADGTIERVSNVPTTADQIFADVVDIDDPDGRPIPTPLVNISSTDFAQTTIYDASDPSQWQPGLEVPGYVYNIIRVR